MRVVAGRPVALDEVSASDPAGFQGNMDPKMVAAAFGMDPEGVTCYLTDHVDDVRLPAATSNPANP